MVTLIPERVSNIHANIWRGNFPLTKGDLDPIVDFPQLESLLNVTPDQDLIEICLTDNTGEVEYLELLELVYGAKFTRSAPPFSDPTWDPRHCFQKADTNRWVIWWPIEGGTTPDVTGPGVGYNFRGLIAYLTRFIAETINETKVYVHCLNGTDRTGAVAAAIAFEHKGMSAKQAIEFASSTPAGTMSEPYLQLVRHYCATP